MPSIFSRHFDMPLYKGELSVNTSLFINGKFVDAADGEVVEVLEPCTGELITKVSSGSAQDINAAVAAAKYALKTSWGVKCPPPERGRLLFKLGDLMEKHRDEICAIEALDTGKNITMVKQVDFAMALSVVRYYGGWADKHSGQTIETNEALFAYTRNEPIGVVGAITPWNYPLLLSVMKIAPILATGNTLVLKPSEVTPLSALKIAELAHEAGFPPGSFNVVTGFGPIAGQALAEHPDVRKVAFTGSNLIGRKIMETAAKTNLKRVSLELGGKSPAVIFEDADLDMAAQTAAMAAFMHSGQICGAGTRLFIQDRIHDKFIEKFAAAAKSLKPSASPFSNVEEGSHSPVVSQTQYERVMGYIRSGREDGANMHVGGERMGEAGYYIQPTIFTDVNPSMKIVREEIFGPVVVVTKFKTEAEVIEMANDTIYGLCGYIFTRDLNRAIRVSNAIEAGTVFINSFFAPGAQLPFGGVKQSGFGRDLGSYALGEYTVVKAVHVKLDMQA